MDEIYDTAFAIKERIYGNRIVLFAPLYLASECAAQWCGAGQRQRRAAAVACRPPLPVSTQMRSAWALAGSAGFEQ